MRAPLFSSFVWVSLSKPDRSPQRGAAKQEEKEEEGIINELWRRGKWGIAENGKQVELGWTTCREREKKQTDFGDASRGNNTLRPFPCFCQQEHSLAEFFPLFPSENCSVVWSFLLLGIKALYEPSHHWMWGIFAIKRCPSRFPDGREYLYKLCFTFSLPNIEWSSSKVMYCLSSTLKQGTPQKIFPPKVPIKFRANFRAREFKIQLTPYIYVAHFA